MSVRKSLVSVLASVSLAGAGALALAPPAQAAIPGIEELRNVATGFCLDSNSSGSAYTHVCNGNEYQKWLIMPGTGATYTLQSRATGLCLDSNGGSRVYTHVCNGGDYQKWTISRATPTGSYVLTNIVSSLVLDSNGSKRVYMHVPNGGDYQQWA
ncbi:RICIN domain-containing protein [Streptomyces qinzhouensis]|nr:RICIN domain-containing protein [Streptomyces qinzhouensis]